MLATYVFVAVSVVYVNAFSSGAPESACQDMIPKHPVPPQKSAAPYVLTPSTKSVKAGTPMEVVISGKAPKDTIRGILLQARVGDKIVGKFTLAPNDNFAQLLNCGEPGNAVTHKKHDEKFDKQTVAFTWTPPAGLNAEVKFRYTTCRDKKAIILPIATYHQVNYNYEEATIALNGAVFWVGVESAPVKVSS